MGNPARELVRYLVAWQSNSNSGMYPVRDGEGPGLVEFWREQAQAVRLVAEVDELLQARKNAGKNVAHFESSLIGAYRCIFAPDVAWSSGNTQRTIDRWDIDILSGFADILDEGSAAYPPVPEEARRTISDALDELMAMMVDGELALDERSALYVSQLIEHVRALVTDADTYGDVDLLRYIYQLIGVLLTMATRAEQQDQPEAFVFKLRDIAARLVPFAKPVRSVLGVVADIGGVQGMLSGD